MSTQPLGSALLPQDHQTAVLVGRLFDPDEAGPSVVAIRGDTVVDLTHVASTTSELFEHPDLVGVIRRAEPRKTWPLEQIVANTLNHRGSGAHFLAPIDLQVVKAAGVTFARSLLERVIEERAAGSPEHAAEVRDRITAVIGGAVGGIRPGSEEAAAVKEVLIREGLWSQYLEVGIGPDPEIFTKAPVLSSVGTGAMIGVLERSTWNNPEPEVVLVVTATGRIVGATLGNDVNLRDFEGRSALLLSEAKDNNASCSIGPLVRVFDGSFDLESVRGLEIDVRVSGSDGYELRDTSTMSEMSRELEDLVAHAFGHHHQYPDGFVLFTGTLFAPTQDRGDPGMGFTHRRGDIVEISTPSLGRLVNEVTSAEDAPEWNFGIRRLIENLGARGLLSAKGVS